MSDSPGEARSGAWTGARRPEDEVARRLRGWVEDTFFVEGFADSDSFLKNRLIDSTGMMELVAFIEGEFGFVAADAELVPDNLDSIDNLVRYVARKQGRG